MKRLFTFGDSYAQYCWPMWPDLLAQSFDYTENYGRAGAGNFYIFNSFVQYMMDHGISHEDTVIVQWTEPARVDYIENFDWAGKGIASAEMIIQNDMPALVSDETVFLKQLSYMANIVHCLLIAGCKWHFIFLSDSSMVHKVNVKELKCVPGIQERYSKIINYLSGYKDRFIDHISMEDFFKSKEMPLTTCSTVISGKPVTFRDSHPTPKYTFDFIKEVFSDKLELENLDAMQSMAIVSDNFIRNQSEDSTYNQSKTAKYFEKMYAANGYKATVRKV